MRNMLYCLADRAFFDAPDRVDDSAQRFAYSDRPAPAGWVRAEERFYVNMRPGGVTLPDQGWKIHVAATAPDAERAIAIVWDYCVANEVAFKFLRSRRIAAFTGSKQANRAGSGKLLTLYPARPGDLETTLTGLAPLLEGIAGPYILSDLRYGNGPLYVRYGAFRYLHCPDAHGEPVYALRRADGTLVPDRRGPVFTLPDEIALPSLLGPSLAARQAAGDGDFPYDIEQALHFSNGGGVYLAVHRPTGERVVLREARPHAGVDGLGTDAVTRVSRERDMLQRLAGLDFVPKVLDYRIVWEHHFLVEEYIPGRTLTDLVTERYPLVHPEVSDTDLASYREWAMDVVDQLRGALAALHGRGIRHGDLHPGNVMVRPDGRVALIDFELAADLADGSAPGLQADGFAAPRGLGGAEADRYALERIDLFTRLPLVQVVARDPAKLTTLTAAAERLFGMAPAVRRWAEAPEPLDEAAAWFAGDPPDWPALRDAIAAGILGAATPQRADRLYPGDPTQFVTGGIALRTGAAGVLLALHQAGVSVPGEHVDWLARTARSPQRAGRTGLYDGRHGVALVLDLLGRHDDAMHTLALARAEGDRVPAAGLLGGRAGIALSLLYFGRRTGDPALIDAALVLAEDLAALVSDRFNGLGPAGLRPPGKPGLMRGPSGVALALLHLYEHTGEDRWLDLAQTALHHDLDRCKYLPDGTLHVLDEGRYLAYVDKGSGGMAMVMREYLRYREFDPFEQAVQAVRRASAVRYVFQPGLFEGRAGVLAVLCQLGDPADKPVLHRHVADLAWHAVTHQGRLAFPGAGLLRLSTDLATGSAGVLLALHAVFEDRRPVLPFLDVRAPAATGFPALPGYGS